MGQIFHRIIPQDNLSKSNLLVHINGAINRLTEARLDDSFKLISQSYAADSFEKSGWAFHFRQDLRTASAVIFIGYSMYDLDIKRIVFDEDISSKCLFVVAPMNPDNELEVEALSDIGTVQAIGIDNFANAFAKTKETYIPEEPELLLSNWDELQLVENISNLPSDQDVLDFLVKGELKKSLLLEAVGPNKGDYILERSTFSNLLDSLSKNGSRVLTVGELGVGKTFINECVAQILLSRGWRVFKLNSSSRDSISECESICALSGNKLLIVENYQRHSDLLRWISDVKPTDVSLSMTARTNIHDFFAKELDDAFGDSLIIHDISILSPKEIKRTVDLFNKHGLWGIRMKWSPAQKETFITKDCNRNWPSVLVDILQSNHITERYKELLSESSSQSDVEKLLICTFSLEVIMAESPRVYIIQELLANRVTWRVLRPNSQLNAIIDFDAHEIRTKSSVLSSYLLHYAFQAKTIVETIIIMLKEAEIRKHERDFGDIFYALMRYSNVSRILPEKMRLQSSINYYEGIKNLQSTRTNPQFWLQYAIACLATGKLERAERYFDDAYSLAGHGYNTYQIDNHYARLQLEKAKMEPSASDSFELIRTAMKIVLQQMRDEVQYYPYRVARGVFDCYKRFVEKWSPEQEAYFTRVFTEIKRRCESTKGNLRKNRNVIDCLALANEMLGES